MPETPTERPRLGRSLSSPFGWLTRDGELYPCLFQGHAELAAHIWKHVFGETPNDPEQAAERAGWIKLAHVSESKSMPVVFAFPTDAQGQSRLVPASVLQLAQSSV